MWHFTGLPGTTTTCALKMFRNSVALEKDPEQVNFIKMRIQGIWDYLDQDQEVGAKHINETQMFQMSSREPMEPKDEEVGDLVDLEDVVVRNPSLCADREAEPRGSWTGRIRTSYKLCQESI